MKRLIAALLASTTLLTATTADAGDWGYRHGYKHGRHPVFYRDDSPRLRLHYDPFWGNERFHNRHHNRFHDIGWRDDDDDYYFNHREENVYIINQSPPRPSYYAPAPRPVGYRTVEVECNDNPNLVGQLLGGAGGGILGNQIGKGHGRTAAIIGGTLIGSMVGGDLTRQDRRCTSQVFNYAEPGTQVVWDNPDTDYNYSIAPQAPYQDRAGRYCREYQAIATVGGRTRDTYGTACMQPDGDWEIVN